MGDTHKDIALLGVPYGNNPEDTAYVVREVIEAKIASMKLEYEIGRLMMVDVPISTPPTSPICNVFLCFEKYFRHGMIVEDLRKMGGMEIREKTILPVLSYKFATHKPGYKNCTWTHESDSTAKKVRFNLALQPVSSGSSHSQQKSLLRSSSSDSKNRSLFQDSNVSSSSFAQYNSSCAQYSTASSLAQNSSTSSSLSASNNSQPFWNSTYSRYALEQELFEERRINEQQKKKIAKLENELKDRDNKLEWIKSILN